MGRGGHGAHAASCSTRVARGDRAAAPNLHRATAAGGAPDARDARRVEAVRRQGSTALHDVAERARRARRAGFAGTVPHDVRNTSRAAAAASGCRCRPLLPTGPFPSTRPCSLPLACPAPPPTPPTSRGECGAAASLSTTARNPHSPLCRSFESTPTPRCASRSGEPPEAASSALGLRRGPKRDDDGVVLLGTGDGDGDDDGGGAPPAGAPPAAAAVVARSNGAPARARWLPSAAHLLHDLSALGAAAARRRPERAADVEAAVSRGRQELIDALCVADGAQPFRDRAAPRRRRRPRRAVATRLSPPPRARAPCSRRLRPTALPRTVKAPSRRTTARRSRRRRRRRRRRR